MNDHRDIENAVLRNNVSERQISDKQYAVKLIENIVFTMIGCIALAVLYAVLKGVHL